MLLFPLQQNTACQCCSAIGRGIQLLLQRCQRCSALPKATSWWQGGISHTAILSLIPTSNAWPFSLQICLLNVHISIKTEIMFLQMVSRYVIRMLALTHSLRTQAEAAACSRRSTSAHNHLGFPGALGASSLSAAATTYLSLAEFFIAFHVGASPLPSPHSLLTLTFLLFMLFALSTPHAHNRRMHKADYYRAGTDWIYIHQFLRPGTQEWRHYSKPLI